MKYLFREITEVGEITPLGIKWKTLHSQTSKIPTASALMLLQHAEQSPLDKSPRHDSPQIAAEHAQLASLLAEDELRPHPR